MCVPGDTCHRYLLDALLLQNRKLDWLDTKVVYCV
jgi:hypothetical protein